MRERKQITKKLKDCPLCGSKASGYVISVDTQESPLLLMSLEIPKACFIECDNCGVSICRDSVEEVIDAWNSRIFEHSPIRLLVPTKTGDYTPLLYTGTLEEATLFAHKVGGFIISDVK